MKQISLLLLLLTPHMLLESTNQNIQVKFPENYVFPSGQPLSVSIHDQIHSLDKDLTLLESVQQPSQEVLSIIEQLRKERNQFLYLLTLEIKNPTRLH